MLNMHDRFDVAAACGQQFDQVASIVRDGRQPYCGASLDLTVEEIAGWGVWTGPWCVRLEVAKKFRAYVKLRIR